MNWTMNLVLIKLHIKLVNSIQPSSIGNGGYRLRTRMRMRMRIWTRTRNDVVGQKYEAFLR